MLLKKKEHTELLVAIVQSPSQDLEFLLHHKEFNALRPHEWLFGEVHITEQKSKCIITIIFVCNSKCCPQCMSIK